MQLATTMADRGVDLSALPKEVRDQLAELDLELSEGKLAGTQRLRLGTAGSKFSLGLFTCVKCVLFLLLLLHWD